MIDSRHRGMVRGIMMLLILVLFSYAGAFTPTVSQHVWNGAPSAPQLSIRTYWDLCRGLNGLSIHANYFRKDDISIMSHNNLNCHQSHMRASHWRQNTIPYTTHDSRHRSMSQYSNILTFRNNRLKSSQNDYMIHDKCVLVDENDHAIGSASKYDAHRFVGDLVCPLHRAFSVFLFNQNNELLLQQRASDKITFPSVWSNTCCSHPLYSQTPNEVDSGKDIAMGNVNGIKYAAQRKLKHELGIDAADIPIESMKYLTRIQYCAKDTITYGSDAVWGEHEIDYILFAKVSNEIKVEGNPEEVGDYKWVNIPTFKQMIDPNSQLLWSPWFRIVADKFLIEWWKNIDATMTTDVYTNHHTIYRC